MGKTSAAMEEIVQVKKVCVIYKRTILNKVTELSRKESHVFLFSWKSGVTKFLGRPSGV